MIELSSEARKAYEVMALSLEQSGQEEQEENTEELQTTSLDEESNSGPDTTQPQEPEYSELVLSDNIKPHFKPPLINYMLS